MISSLAINVTDLHFAYPDGRNALCGVSLSIDRSEKIALLGPNGAGKSTLLLHLNGILKGVGEVHVLGTDLSRAGKRELREVRAKVGLVFQDPDDQLFSPTVGADVAFGPLYMGLDAQEVEIRVADALQAVGLKDFAARMPHRMSGGEKRRAALATVLSMKPDILVADEPSAGLDPKARRQLIKLLKSLGQTLLVATHDLDLAAAVCPRSILMSEGLIVADGPTDSILSDHAVLESAGL